MFRIGEFSQIAQVPTSQLRYYDEIGLLKPAKIDQWTSYRFYSVEQLPQLHRILALRELGLSLEQIKRLIADNISVEEIRGMFTLRKAQIEQTLQDEISRLRTIEARLQHLEQGNQADDVDVVLKSLPEQPFIGVRVQLPNIYDAFEIVQKMRQLIPPVVGRSNLGHITILFHSSFFRETDTDVSLGFALSKPATEMVTLGTGLVATPQRLPAVPLVATAVRQGGPENNIHTHAAVGRWAVDNGYRLLNEGREVVITPPRSRTDRQQMVTEIQYPIERQIQQ
ncbi:MAG: MerR family transcriptional regulator [Chloroflexota bacterium]